MRPIELLTSALLFATAGQAWPSAWSPFEVVKRELAPLVVRQAASSTSFNLNFSGTQGNTATTVSTTSATATGSNAVTTGTAQASGSANGSESGTQSTGGKTTYASTKTFDARLPAGGVQMITPAAIAAASYYKIADYVTFAWNYTSLSVTPSAVDILASCSLNSETYTIALNQSITASTQAVTWDTGAYQASATVPLLTNTYTLIIHDAAKDVSATAQAGYLATYEQFTFGMYVPQPYTPIADWVCATCSGATSVMERQTMGFVFGMVALTVMSFGWFTGAAGLW